MNVRSFNVRQRPTTSIEPEQDRNESFDLDTTLSNSCSS